MAAVLAPLHMFRVPCSFSARSDAMSVVDAFDNGWLERVHAGMQACLGNAAAVCRERDVAAPLGRHMFRIVHTPRKKRRKRHAAADFLAHRRRIVLGTWRESSRDESMAFRGAVMIVPVSRPDVPLKGKAPFRFAWAAAAIGADGHVGLSRVTAAKVDDAGLARDEAVSALAGVLPMGATLRLDSGGPGGWRTMPAVGADVTVLRERAWRHDMAHPECQCLLYESIDCPVPELAPEIGRWRRIRSRVNYPHCVRACKAESRASWAAWGIATGGFPPSTGRLPGASGPPRRMSAGMPRPATSSRGARSHRGGADRPPSFRPARGADFLSASLRLSARTLSRYLIPRFLMFMAAARSSLLRWPHFRQRNS
jgi:hypothetical protein